MNESIRSLLKFLLHPVPRIRIGCLQNMLCTARAPETRVRVYTYPPLPPNEDPTKCNIRFLNRQTSISVARNNYSRLNAASNRTGGLNMTPDMQLCVAMRLFSAQVERKCLLERFELEWNFIRFICSQN